MQKFKFPMEYLRVTQGENDSFSHAGSLAMDFGGKDGGADRLYCPCDMVVKRCRHNANGELYLESTLPVEFADSTTDYARLLCVHDSVFNVVEGRVLKQGDYFYDEGGMGSGNPAAFATHVHIEAGKGKWKSCTQSPNSQGTYVIENQSHLYDLFILGNDVKILDGSGYPWKRASDKNKKIIDVSRYQGDINWDKVKAAGIEGALLKTVSTNNREFGGLYIDPYFEKNYGECKRVGIPVGAYYYTYAQDLGYAKKELALFKQAVTGKQFELPLVIDVEDNTLKPLSADALTDLVEYAVKEIESWGCYAMVYTYLNYQNTELNMDRLAKYDMWLAAYRDNRPTAPNHSIWQFTSSGSIPGINGNCDVNWQYPNKDGKYHDEIIKAAGLNGWVSWDKTDKYLEVVSNRCEYFNSTDANDIVGKLPNGTIYECTEISNRPINGFVWVKFKKIDGEYYAVILEDRSKLVDKPTDNEVEIEKLTAELKVANNALAAEKESNATLTREIARLSDMVNKVREAVK